MPCCCASAQKCLLQWNKMPFHLSPVSFHNLHCMCWSVFANLFITDEYHSIITLQNLWKQAKVVRFRRACTLWSDWPVSVLSSTINLLNDLRNVTQPFCASNVSSIKYNIKCLFAGLAIIWAKCLPIFVLILTCLCVARASEMMW